MSPRERGRSGQRFGDAVRWARRIRTAILAEYPPAQTGQLSFDDYLSRPAG